MLRARRLLPLLLKPCRVPEPIARLTHYDFPSTQRRGEVLARLLRQLEDAYQLMSQYTLAEVRVTVKREAAQRAKAAVR